MTDERTYLQNAIAALQDIMSTPASPSPSGKKIQAKKSAAKHPLAAVSPAKSRGPARPVSKLP